MADSYRSSRESFLTRLRNRQAPSTLTIPKVPERLRRGETDAYEPRIISFGPYHHGKPSLQSMEKYKRSFRDAILSSRPEISRQQFINAIKEEEAKIRTYYTDDFDITSEKFVEMMLIDGCFLVGYFRFLAGYFRRVSDELDGMVWMHELIRYDILLLENQLPFFILIKILELLQLTTPPFMYVVINYLDLGRQKKVNFRPPEPVHHLLHLYHSYCLYTPAGEVSPVLIHGKQSGPIHQPPSAAVLPEEEALIIQTHGEESDYPSSTVPHEAEVHQPHSATVLHEAEEHQPPSATVLHEAGVKFEKKEVKGSSSLDVTFNITNGKMMIPPLVIDSCNMSRLRNLVAFEQFYPYFDEEFNKNFTAYVEFMDFIVNTPADVALLHKHGIIRHFLGSDKNVAAFFNVLNQGVYVKQGHYLAPLYRDIYNYQQKRWHTWRAMLIHNYCNSPWAVLGIVAGGILLALTLLQTIFSGLSA